MFRNKNAGNKNDREKTALFVVIILDLLFLGLLIKYLSGMNLNFQLLNTKGYIADREKQVIITAVLLMLIVVIPVFSALFWITHKYRADKNNEYQPEWEGNKGLQFLWWAFPGTIIICLGILTWNSSHALDPFKPIDSPNKPITVEVVALEWKWLFIYPQQNIATVNFVEFPQQTPVDFVLTSDAPMNSFWIPQLGGQMYAMAGMTTQLHLMADQTGEFNGSAAEINGKGFSGMRFIAKSVTGQDFQNWVKTVKQGKGKLDTNSYPKLAQPSTDNSVSYYASVYPDLFNNILEKYIGPANTNNIPAQ